MRIQCDNNINYGTLYRGMTIKNLLHSGHSKKFESELKEVERSVRKNELHKKENVDIILNYNKKDGFYGVISSKKQGIPMNPANKQKISKDEQSMKAFSDWVNGWNEQYSPERLSIFDEVIKFYKESQANKIS